MKVYIAGPMRGIPDLNFPNFNRVAKSWRDAGYEVCNPAELGEDPAKPFTYYMRRDLAELLKCDGIVLLQGWEDSQGAKNELAVAKMIGIPSFLEDQFWWANLFRKGEPLLIPGILDSLSDGKREITVERREMPELKNATVKLSICQEADSLIHGDRRGDYGHPLDDYERTVAIYKAIKGSGSIDTAEDGVLFMQCVKLSRQANRWKRDNLVDLCGYTGLLEMIREERDRRAKEISCVQSSS